MDFLKYLEAVERTQLNTYAQSPAGRVQLAKTGKRPAHPTSASLHGACPLTLLQLLCAR